MPTMEGCSAFDYSTPEAVEAMRNVTSLVLQIREEMDAQALRKIRLYERSLGLAVIPVMLGQAAHAVARRIRHRHLGSA